MPQLITTSDRICDYRAKLGPRAASQALAVTGYVNSASFASHPTGTLMLVYVELNETGVWVTFSRNLSRPWTHYPTTDGLFELVEGVDGKPLFDSTDFASLDDPGSLCDIMLVKGSERECLTTFPFPK